MIQKKIQHPTLPDWYAVPRETMGGVYVVSLYHRDGTRAALATHDVVVLLDGSDRHPVDCAVGAWLQGLAAGAELHYRCGAEEAEDAEDAEDAAADTELRP